MKPTDRARASVPVRPESAAEEKHLWDYARVVYKRRWIATPAFLLVFSAMTFNAMRETPVYRSQAASRGAMAGRAPISPSASIADRRSAG